MLGDSIPTLPQADAALNLQAHAEQVGSSLRASLEAVVLAISGPTPRPSHLINRAGLDKSLAGRIIQTIRAPDPLTALVNVPAPVGLGLFIRGARGAGVAREPIARVESAIDGFERLLSRFPRGREGLEAALSGWIPEEREQGERTARKSVFKAMSFIFGHQSEATLGCTILKPSATGNTLDSTFVSGQFGLRRLRAGQSLSIFGRRYYPPQSQGDQINLNPTTLDGKPIAEASSVLEEFCLPRAPKLEIIRSLDQVLFVLPANFPEINEPISLVLAHQQQRGWSRFASPQQAEESQAILVRCPTRVFINDMFLRDDVYEGVEPVVTTHIAGMSPNPPRERGPGFPLDEFHVSVKSGWVSGSLRDIGTGDIPRYPELMEQVFHRIGEDPRRYRVHRLRMHYPLYGIAATRWFKLPENPHPTA